MHNSFVNCLKSRSAVGEKAISDTVQGLLGADHKVPRSACVEDWSCGSASLARYLGSHQSYIGIDGSHSRFANIDADLEHYRSIVGAIFIRHVLEHNPNWPRILENALQSFTKRMVLILFTPYPTQTCVLRE